MNINRPMWQIFIRKRGSGSILYDLQTPYIPVPNPKYVWAADPFITEENGIVYIFAELYDFSKKKGEIACCQYNGNRFSKRHVVIEEKYHMSYPNVLKKGKNYYMVPETGAANCIQIYEAIEFPYKWKNKETILTGRTFTDTTELGNNWIISYDASHNDESLLLIKKGMDLSVDREKQDYQHVLRPAGKVFERNGMVIRLAQNCGRIYGGSLRFYNVKKVDNTGIQEELIKEIYEGDIPLEHRIKNSVGIHTYNSSDNYEVIDIRFSKFSLKYIIQRIIGKIIKNEKKTYKYNSPCI